MEPQSSLPYSHAPATCPYPEPTPSSPHNLFPLPEDPSEHYLPIYVLVSPTVSFPQVSRGEYYDFFLKETLLFHVKVWNIILIMNFMTTYHFLKVFL